MMMKIFRICSAVFLVALLLASVSCGEREPSYDDRETRETFEKETYATVDGADMTFHDGLAKTAYASDMQVGAWLAGCASPDRDDRFDAYILRRESASEGNTTFTYLIYYPHGATALAATPELLERDGGYTINLRYKPGTGTEGYTLSYLSVTLPTDEAPRLRLLVNEEPLGVMSTVAADNEAILPGE